MTYFVTSPDALSNTEVNVKVRLFTRSPIFDTSINLLLSPSEETIVGVSGSADS